MDALDFVSELAKLKSNSTFIAIKGYRSENDEVADYSLSFNMSYTNALKRSIATVEAMSLSNDLEREARTELLASWNKSLSNPEKVEQREPAYDYYVNEDMTPIKGIKLHVATNTLHLYGLVNAKRIYLPGNYKVVKSAPLTIAKKKMTSLTACGKFRQFRITPDKVDSISVRGLELLPPE